MNPRDDDLVQPLRVGGGGRLAAPRGRRASRRTAPGYREIPFRPRPGGGLTSASAAHETPYGRAAIAWTRDGDRLTVDVTVPTGTTATVDLPGVASQVVASGDHRFSTTL